MLTVANVLRRLPPDVAATLREPIQEVLTVRTGNLLWFGAIVGLWTATSFIETIRDILRRAYGVKFCAPFWEYRLGSILMILGAVLLLMIAFAASVALSSLTSSSSSGFRWRRTSRTTLGLYRLVPAGDLVLHLLRPLLRADAVALPEARLPQMAGRLADHRLVAGDRGDSAQRRSALFGGYSRTYGSLAGVMIALIFFFVVGLGVVIGAELNAALAESGATALKGEIYTGPYTDELEVEEPQLGEDVKIGAANGGTATLTGLMQGKRGLIMGLANDRSLAWGIARAVGEQGAELAFSYQGEALEKRVRPLAAELGSDILVDCDVSDMKALDKTFDALKERWGTLDFVVHAIGYSDKNELRGKFVDTSMDNFLMTMNISVYSFVAVAQRARALMSSGGSILTLTYYGAEKVIPHYNVMGVAKSGAGDRRSNISPRTLARRASASTRFRPARSRRWPRAVSATSATS